MWGKDSCGTFAMILSTSGRTPATAERQTPDEPLAEMQRLLEELLLRQRRGCLDRVDLGQRHRRTERTGRGLLLIASIASVAIIACCGRLLCGTLTVVVVVDGRSGDGRETNVAVRLVKGVR